MIEGSWNDLLTQDLFTPYAVIFWGVLAVRLFRSQISRAELLVLAMLVGHHLLEVLQLVAGNANLRLTMLPHRYFGAAAPLAWGWTAYGLVILWRTPGRWRIPVRVGVGLLLLYVVLYLGVIKLHKEGTRGTARDAQVAAQAIAPFLAEDYTGPRTTPDYPHYTVQEYFTPRRPVVLGAYAAASWYVRGQGALSDLAYPDAEDYYFARADKTPPELRDPARYTLLKEVRGTRHRWHLYRRILDGGERGAERPTAEP